MKVLNSEKQFSGLLGDYVFYTSNGRTYARSRAVAPRNSRTPRLMYGRTSWSNLVNLWKAFPRDYKPVFEHRRDGTTNYNQFISVNLPDNRIFLTKTMARNGGCVMVPCLVSDGPLCPIDLAVEGPDVVSNVELGSLVLGPDTTLQDFSVAVIRNNEGFQPGDSITHLLAVQHVDPTDGRPFVSMTGSSLRLNLSDTSLLRCHVGRSTGFGIRGGRMACTNVPLGGVVWIHSRTNSQGTAHVSRQQFYCNTQALMGQYGSDEAFARACQSYGTPAPTPFLTPNSNQG